MDILSDVLNVVRLNGGAFYTAEFTSPWAVFTPPADELAVLMQTRAESVAVFHIFVEGECWISLKGTDPFSLSAGSAIIFSHSPSHELASKPGLDPLPIISLLTHPEGAAIPAIRHGGGGPLTRFFCGYLQCNHRFNPLMGALPSLIIATPDDDVARVVSASGTSGSHGANMPHTPRCVVLPTGDEWLRKTSTHLVDEAFDSRPGTPVMLERLVELFYVEVLRRYIAHASLANVGWFAAMNDVEVGRALRMLHAEPARKWTVDELADCVGVSRSVLAQRFTALAGESPMRYLTNWRMQVAKDLILQGNLSLPQIAERIGYESEEAFNRAFKREIGEPPGAWRDFYLA